MTNPCQVILAQEVDHNFIKHMCSCKTRRNVPNTAVAGAGSGSSGSTTAGAGSSSSGYAAAGGPSSSSAPAAAGGDSSSLMTIKVLGGEGDPYGGWLVAFGDEPGPTCIVAGKRSMFKSITRLEWHKPSGGQFTPPTKRKDGTKKDKVDAWSRILVAELEFWRPIAGLSYLRVASVHMHRHPAARRQGFKVGADDFWTGLHHRLQKLNVHIVGGDFNMSMYDAVARLKPLGTAVTLLAAHAWRQVGVISKVTEQPDEDDDDDERQPAAMLHSPPAMMPLRIAGVSWPNLPARAWEMVVPSPGPGTLPGTMPPPEPRALPRAMPPPPTMPPPRARAPAADITVHSQPAVAGKVECLAGGPEDIASIRCDSCGIFAVGRTDAVKRFLSVEHFTGSRTMQLEERLEGPGFKVESYMGDIQGVKDSLTHNATFTFSDRAAALPTNKRQPLPPCRQKLMKQSDPTGLLSRNGAQHMPLAVFVGTANSTRSQSAWLRRASKQPPSRARSVRCDRDGRGGGGGGQVFQ